MRIAFIITMLTAFAFTPAVCAQDDFSEKEIDAITEKYEALWRKGDYQGAFDIVTGGILKCVNQIPFRWLYDRADLHFTLGDTDAAISDWEWLHYRHPSPKSALRLATLYRHRGRLKDYEILLSSAAHRFRRFKGDEGEIDNELALYRIKELLGENPKPLFDAITQGKSTKDTTRVQRFLAAAGLAWRKFDYALAAEYYQKALDLEPENLDAKIGLAECYWKSYDPRLSDMLEAVLEVNPNHPRALAVKVELALDQRNLDEVDKLVQQVLDFNRNHLQFLGYKIAAAFLRDDKITADDTRWRALQYNPHASEIHRIPGRLASRHYRFREGAELQQQALEIDPNDHTARAFYAFDLLRLGQDEEGRTQLERAFKEDPYNVQVYNMLQLLDTLSGFESIAKGPFLIKMPKNEVPIWGDEVVQLLETVYKRYTAEYMVTPHLPIGVQIFDQHDDFMVRSVGLPGSVGHLGICFGRLITMDSPTARSKGAMNWRAVLWHEFLHVITLQKTDNRMPRWLSEGISVYEEQRGDPSWRDPLDVRFKVLLSEDGFPDLSKLEGYFTNPRGPLALGFGYFAAGEFVEAYVNHWSKDALVHSMDFMAEGMDAVKALARAADTEPATLDKVFVKHMEQRLIALETLPEVPNQGFGSMFSQGPSPLDNPGAFMAGSSPFTDAVTRGATAMNKGDVDAAEKAYLEALDLFPEYNGQDGPLPALAQIYEKQGQTQKLRDILKRALQLEAANLPAALKLSEIEAKAEAWHALADVTQRGLAVDPFDRHLLRRRLKAFAALKDRDALTTAQRLILLDPEHAPDYRLQRVDLLLEFDQKPKARMEILSLLEEMPYYWEAQQRLLNLVEDADQPSPSP